MYHEVRGDEAMGYLSTKPTMIITTLHESGIVNAGVFGAYTNLSPTPRESYKPHSVAI